MKTFKIFWLLLFSIIVAKAQTPYLSWAKLLGSNGGVMGYSISIDNSGNIYTTGHFQGSVDFDPGIGVYSLTSSGSDWNIFISKLDSVGNFVWAKQFGGSGDNECYASKVDGNGNIFLAGIFTETTDFDPNSGIFNLTSAGYEDIVILKIDNIGNLVWVKKIGGSSADIPWAIDVDQNGLVYVIGIFNSPIVDFDPGIGTNNLTPDNGRTFITKFNNLGNLVWARQIAGQYGNGQGISVDNDGNVYLTGGFSNSADFDPGSGVFTLISAGSGDIFVTKLNSSGDFSWAKQMGSTQADCGYSIALDNVGNVYTTGVFSNTVDFDPGNGMNNLSVGNLDGNCNVFISKLNSSGNFVWAKSFVGVNTGYGNAINTDNTNNVYVTGKFTQTTDFDPGNGIYNLNGAADIFIAKLDSAGNFRWALKEGEANSGNDYGESIIIDADNYVYITGWFFGTADFDPGSGVINLTVGGPGGFVQKLCQSPMEGNLISGLDTICPAQTGVIYSTSAIEGATGYTWDLPNGANILSGGNTNSIVVNFDWQAESGVITVRGTNTCGEGNVSENFLVTVVPLPIITANDTTAFCEGGDVSLTSSYISNNLWNTGETSNEIIVSNSGGYSVEINSNGCQLFSDTIQVTVFPITETPTITLVNNTFVTSQWESYYWFLDNNYISGANSQSFTPIQNGAYFVIVTDSNGCTASSDTIIFNSLGVFESNINDLISAYPNPTSGLIHLKFISSSFQKYDVILTDIFGKEVLRKTIENAEAIVDITKYDQGIYFLRIFTTSNGLTNVFRIEKI